MWGLSDPLWDRLWQPCCKELFGKRVAVHVFICFYTYNNNVSGVLEMNMSVWSLILTSQYAFYVNITFWVTSGSGNILPYFRDAACCLEVAHVVTYTKTPRYLAEEIAGWPSGKLPFECKKLPKTWHFFKKLPKIVKKFYFKVVQ